MPPPNSSQLDCTAVLMAGGQSSRMGRDKAWLDHRGRPLWLAQVEKLKFAREVLISARETTFAEAPSGCRLIFDDVSGKGPVAGLQTALKAATFDRVLLLAVDMPGMTSEYLRGLAEEATSEIGIVPEVNGFYEGLAAVYPKSSLPLVEEVLEGEDLSLQHLCRELIARNRMKARLVREEEALFRNWNRPEDVG
jgi:molybdenum cofactor guanylyltransferase